jgi:hypothetical protein
MQHASGPGKSELEVGPAFTPRSWMDRARCTDASSNKNLIELNDAPMITSHSEPRLTWASANPPDKAK